MGFNVDIDIDFQSGFQCQDIFPQAVRASMVNKKDYLVPHPCGFYFQNIDIDPVTELAAIPYEESEILGYFKIDFLRLSAIDPIQSKQEIRDLSKKEPDWDLLSIEENVFKLAHISKYYSLLQKLNPRSVNDLADILALIRPSKRHLIDRFAKTNLKNKEELRKELYSKPIDGQIWFKKSHSISYVGFNNK
jgi:hypothetical protein